MKCPSPLVWIHGVALTISAHVCASKDAKCFDHTKYLIWLDRSAALFRGPSHEGHLRLHVVCWADTGVWACAQLGQKSDGHYHV